MHYKQSLRFRITFSFVIFAAMLSTAIAAGVYFAVEDIEEELIDERVKSELDYVIRHESLSLDSVKQITADTRLYYIDNLETSTLLTDDIKNLPIGLHEWHDYDKGVSAYVLVKDLAEGRVFLIKEATEFENREKAIQIALIVMVVMSIAIALWLGHWLSGKVILPVSNLAAHVGRLKPLGERSPHIALNYAQDEVGQLASAFDQYLKQIQQFIQREQDFTADASHELRTPLAVIKGAAELLLESENLTEREMRQVERINRAAERMAQMLEILLMLAREMPSAGVHEITEKSSVQEVALEVVEQFRFLIKDKNIRLCTEVINDFDVSVSKSVLSIVLTNLVKNAIDHTQEGEIKLKLQGREITIQDTGAGIKDDDKQHVFDRFYRGKANKRGGSGIGLSIVKRICDRQGWQIQLESELGQGTSVTVRF